jgi:basic membrane lipoprotein Med (substrate-binding protein (PBP1-ABC) superfamily)
VRAICLGLLLVLTVASSACSDGGTTTVETPEAAPVPVPDPTAPVAARVGVVLPPTSELDAAALASIDDHLARLSESTDDTVLELRGYAATDPRFVEDVALWLSEQGAAMVCVLGDRAEEVMATLARSYRGLRFCALPVEPPPPDVAGATPASDRVARVDLRVEELGHLVGVAARAQAGDGVVGLVLGGDELPEDRFRVGLLAGLAGAEVVEVDVPNDEAATLSERAETVLTAGAEVVVVDGGVGASEAVSLIGDRAEVIGPSTVLADAAPTDVALRWGVRWDTAMAGPLNALAGGPELAFHTSVGLNEDVFEVAVGAGATEPVSAALEVATAGLRDRTIDPSVPSPPAPARDDDAPGSGPAAGSEREPADPDRIGLDRP